MPSLSYSNSQPLLCPIYMIAAPASRQGKTLFTAALARHYLNAGYRVQVFKIGPDFLDPKLLAYASGQNVDNLDVWMMGQVYCQTRLALARRHNDIVLIETVMGLYDHQPSNADFALKFNIPILLLIDARSMGASFAAIAYGYCNLQVGLNIIGVIANRVSSPNHQQLIQTKLPAKIKFLGAIGNDVQMQLAERHLGLYQPHELQDLDNFFNQAAKKIPPAVMAKLKIFQKKDRLIPSNSEFQTQYKENINNDKKSTPFIIAIANDAAFNFIYQGNLDFLAKCGCDWVFFSPLEDQQLPDCDAVWLTGGYPELYAEQLSQNTLMKAAIQQHVKQQKPLYAECGGMLYLAEQLCTHTGQSYPMCAVLSGQAVMAKKLQGIGMQRLNWGNKTIRGHSFHHARFDTHLPVKAYSQHRNKARQGEAFYQYGHICASFLHLWFASSATITRKFFGIQ